MLWVTSHCSCVVLHPLGFVFLIEEEGISVPYFLSLKDWSSLYNMCPGADSVAPRIFQPLDKCIIMHSPQRARHIVVFPTASKKNPAEKDEESPCD